MGGLINEADLHPAVAAAQPTRNCFGDAFLCMSQPVFVAVVYSFVGRLEERACWRFLLYLSLFYPLTALFGGVCVVLFRCINFNQPFARY